MRPAPSPAVVLVVVLWLAVVAPAGLGRAAAEDAAPPPTAPVARLAVTSLADGSSSSLRHVLLQANSYAGLAHADAPVLVTLNVSGIVRLQSSLPPIAVPIHIRQGLADPATAAAAFGSSFTFVVDGSLVPSPPPSAPVLRGLDLLPSANGSVISDIAVRFVKGHGIYVGANATTLQRVRVCGCQNNGVMVAADDVAVLDSVLGGADGNDANRLFVDANEGAGLRAEFARRLTVGRCVASRNNAEGILLWTTRDAVIADSYIGTNITGGGDNHNKDGIMVSGALNTQSVNTTITRCVVGSNSNNAAIWVYLSFDCTITDTLIGLDASGRYGLFSYYGVLLNGPARGTLIENCTFGTLFTAIDSYAQSPQMVRNCRFNTDVTGTLDLASESYAVFLEPKSQGMTITDSKFAGGWGNVFVQIGSHNNLISGNTFTFLADGVTPAMTDFSAVRCRGYNNRFENNRYGPSPIAIHMEGDNNAIVNETFGLAADGSAALPDLAVVIDGSRNLLSRSLLAYHGSIGATLAGDYNVVTGTTFGLLESAGEGGASAVVIGGSFNIVNDSTAYHTRNIDAIIDIRGGAGNLVSFVNLNGAPSGAGIHIRQAAGNASFPTHIGPNVTVFGCSFEGVLVESSFAVLDGVVANNNAKTGVEIRGGVQGVQMLGCTVQDNRGETNVLVADANDTLIRDCTFGVSAALTPSTSLNTRMALPLKIAEQASGTRLERVVLAGSQLNGVEVYGLGTEIIDSLVTRNAQHGVVLAASAAQSRLSNVHVHSNGQTGILLQVADASIGNGTLVEGNGGSGLHLGQSGDTAFGIVGVSFVNNSGYGLDMVGRAVIASCYFEGNRAGGLRFAVPTFDFGSRLSRVEDCHFVGHRSTPTTAGVDISGVFADIVNSTFEANSVGINVTTAALRSGVQGCTFLSNGIGSVISGPNAALRSCTFSSNKGEAAVVLASNFAEVTNITIRNSLNAGMVVRDGGQGHKLVDIEVDNCRGQGIILGSDRTGTSRLVNSTASWSDLDGVNVRGEGYTIEGCLMEGNHGDGILVSPGGEKLHLLTTTLYGNSGNGATFFAGGAIVTSVSASGNGGNGLFLGPDATKTKLSYVTCSANGKAGLRQLARSVSVQRSSFEFNGEAPMLVSVTPAQLPAPEPPVLDPQLSSVRLRGEVLVGSIGVFEVYALDACVAGAGGLPRSGENARMAFVAAFSTPVVSGENTTAPQSLVGPLPQTKLPGWARYLAQTVTSVGFGDDATSALSACAAVCGLAGNPPCDDQPTTMPTLAPTQQPTQAPTLAPTLPPTPDAGSSGGGGGGGGGAGVAVGAVVAVVVVVVVVLVILLVAWRWRKQGSEQQREMLMNELVQLLQVPNLRASDLFSSKFGGVLGTTEECERRIAELETSDVDVRGEHMRLLGEGQSGKVLLGLWNGQSVAVKMLHDGMFSGQTCVNLLLEGRVMAMLEPHSNVVQLLAVQMRRAPVMLVVEYCTLGDLRRFVRERKDTPATSTATLRHFVWQAASALAFLHSKMIIHRDVAARNVLVQNQPTAGCEYTLKLGDLGLSRSVQDDLNYYRKRSDDSIPVKWMCPTAVALRRFTKKSDVWSFGILVWEMFSFGASPYENLLASEVLLRTQQGYRLDSPDGCPEDVYVLLLRCWTKEETLRPAMLEVRTIAGAWINQMAWSDPSANINSVEDTDV